MAVQTPAPQSRRAILAAALGAGAATIASALGRPLPAAAANGDPVTVGGSFIGTSLTSISNTTNLASVLEASSTNGIAFTAQSQSTYGVYSTSGSGIAMHGESTSGIGVRGTSGSDNAVVGSSGSARGVFGTSATGVGVYGEAHAGGLAGVEGHGDPGVRGQGGATSASGVVGLANGVAAPGTALAPSTGVYGESGAGIGMLGISSNGTSPAVLGRSTARKSGVQGFSGSGLSDAPPAPAADTGVFGTASADLGTGVWGKGASSPTSNSVGVVGEGDTGVVGSGIFGVLGSASAAGIGVYGSASNAAGAPPVFGKTGVVGQSDAGGTAVVGFTGVTAHQPPPDTGIYGRSDTGGAGGRGLTGFCSTGIGLLGQTETGVGVRAYCGNNTGVGLQVTGKAAFDRSGKLTITAGHSSITKTGIGLSALSFILATLQKNVAGLFIQAVVPNPAGSSFTIYLNKAPTVSVVVAWMAVN
jgi:hypothetical protein